jgi:hypothetical protein
MLKLLIMKKAFLMVGHSNWGKSETLAHLTKHNRKKKYVEISGEWFFIRRMSNDDNEEKLMTFIESAHKYNCHLIIAFCPTFQAGEKGHKMLTVLSKDFEIHPFVLMHEYSGTRVIERDEIVELEKYGKCKKYIEQGESTARSIAFKKYINSKL